MPDHATNLDTTKVWLVGGGIAALTAAAFMVRGGDIPGRDITILEERDRVGGSLDRSGSPEQGYIPRGGRMFERKYLRAYALFDSIPALLSGATMFAFLMDFVKFPVFRRLGIG